MIASERPAAVESGRDVFASAGGRWAGEQLLSALQEGRSLSAAELRTCDTLRKDEWKNFDEALIAEGEIRLRGVRALLEAGLSTNIPNAFGKTVHEWEDITDMDPAVVSLDGLARGDDDRQEFSLNSLPLPITHKDFNIGIRTLSASRERGEPLNTIQTRTAGRLVFEKFESMLFSGYPNAFRGLNIYGLCNHPDRNTGTYSSGNWLSASGDAMLDDLQAAMTALETARFYGPYWVMLPTGYGVPLSSDFKANSDKTIRQRLLEVDEIDRLVVCDQMPSNEIVVFQPSPDVVEWAVGEEVQTVQWDLYGGFQIAFKVLGIQVPIVKSTAAGRSGIYHLTA